MHRIDTDTLSVQRVTPGTLPDVPFSDMKHAVLGDDYTLSIVFVGTKEMRRLNATYRGKDYATTVLAFPLDEETGEIVCCLGVIRSRAHKHGHTYATFVPQLLFHAMLHLKGYAHGSKMEEEERTLMRRFGFITS